MKLKKGIKRFFVLLLVIALIIVSIFAYKKFSTKKEEVKEIKIVNQVEKYDYKLKENKSKKYKELFKELKKILENKPVEEEEYVKKITEMFITDFYTLDDKTTKSDVGGVDFLHKDVIENFLVNAEDTYYKYLESNLYDNRNQNLPEVEEVTINSVTKSPYTIGSNTDENAYKVEASWTYTKSDFSTYQSSATLIFVHDDIKLVLVELQ